jgi:hypothetical protein
LAHHSTADTLIWLGGFTDGGGGGSAKWTFPVSDGKWSAVALTYDKSSSDTPPGVRVNFVGVTPDNAQQNPGIDPVPADPGYCVGNETNGTRTWNGKLAHIQVFNRILTPAEQDACLREPGSVTSGLRLWLPMTTAADTTDRSGNSFHGTPTDLTTGREGPPVMTHPEGAPAGIDSLNAGVLPVTQHVILRYADGVTYPAGELEGTGANSVIVATADTQNLPAATRSIVITEGYDQQLSEWQVGSIPLPPPAPAYSPAVLQPRLLNCTIAGYSTTGYATNDYVNDQPPTMTSAEDLYDGYRGYGNGGIVDNVCFFYIPGTALDIARAGSQRNGQMLPHDRLKWIVSRVSVRRVFRGIESTAVDSYMRDIEVEGFREYGVKLFASVQFQNIHTYGGGRTDVLGGGAGLWITDQQNLGSGLYLENSPIGLRIDGPRNSITGLTSHACATNNILLDGQANTISQIDLRWSPVNVLINADQNFIHTGKIQLQDGGVGVRITSPNLHHIRDIIFDGFGPADDAHPANEYSEGATAIDVDATLNFCTIHAFVGNCSTGIDFRGGGIGTNNVIWINTAANVADPVFWPLGETWSPNVKTTETNDIRINGIRQYKQ